MAKSVYTVQWRDAEGDTQVSEFDTGKAAWAFMRLCDAHGVPAGYPQWRKPGES